MCRQAPAGHLEHVSPQGTRNAVRQGVVVEALSFKTALLIMEFPPQFVSSSEPLILQLILLESICVLLNAAMDVMAVVAAHRVRISGIVETAHAQLMTCLSGVTLMGLGGAVLAAVLRDVKVR